MAGPIGRGWRAMVSERHKGDRGIMRPLFSSFGVCFSRHCLSNGFYSICIASQEHSGIRRSSIRLLLHCDFLEKRGVRRRLGFYGPMA
jgi:hypothetical protein